MNKIITAALLVLLGSSAMALTPQEQGLAIAVEGDKRGEGYGDSKVNLKMVLVNKKGRESARDMRVKGLEGVGEEGDKSLSTFSIDHDREFRIPLIKKAIKAAGGELTLYASPWSAPAFMKSNNNMLQGGKLLPEYFDTWATYFTKFIKSYEAEGMPIVQQRKDNAGLTAVMSNSFGFGGTNACLIFEKVDN